MELKIPLEICDVLIFFRSKCSFFIFEFNKFSYKSLIWQPLHYASDAGKLEIVKILCAKKVNLNFIVFKKFFLIHLLFKFKNNS